RLMAARFPYYLLSDTPEGIEKESDLTGQLPLSPLPETDGDIRKGFVYKRVPHITLKAIANNEDVNAIHAKWQESLESLRAKLNAALRKTWQEWEVPRAAEDSWPSEARSLFFELRTELSRGEDARPSKVADHLRGINKQLKRKYTVETLPERPVDPWPVIAATLHSEWWNARQQRQREIDASIARRADTEMLCDQPYEENKRVRVTGPFTVESLSPHRTISVEEKKRRAEAGDPKLGLKIATYGPDRFGN
ncbi:MAG: site-specific DNA-methyltransferase, partial [Verrucomicrobia bacterium]|nr:site-specific DNA-methyltransferase [Verrucomicrobiota bacterium]